MFAEHSWYLRNALVRANYKNSAQGIDYAPEFLERFFRNMLLGEEWELKNRYLVINPPEDYKEQPRHSTHTSALSSTQDKNNSTQEKGKKYPRKDNRSYTKHTNYHKGTAGREGWDYSWRLE